MHVHIESLQPHISSLNFLPSFLVRDHDLLKFVFLPGLVYIMCPINALWMNSWEWKITSEVKQKQKSLVNSN